VTDASGRERAQGTQTREKQKQELVRSHESVFSMQEGVMVTSRSRPVAPLVVVGRGSFVSLEHRESPLDRGPAPLDSPAGRATEYLLHGLASPGAAPTSSNSWIDIYLASRALLIAQRAGVPVDQSRVQIAADTIADVPEESNAANRGQDRHISIGRAQRGGAFVPSCCKARMGTEAGALLRKKQSNAQDTAVVLDTLLSPGGLQVDDAVCGERRPLPGGQASAPEPLRPPAGAPQTGSWPATNESDKSDAARAATCLACLLSSRSAIPEGDLSGVIAEQLAKGFHCREVLRFIPQRPGPFGDDPLAAPARRASSSAICASQTRRRIQAWPSWETCCRAFSRGNGTMGDGAPLD